MPTAPPAIDCPPAKVWQSWLDETLSPAERPACNHHLETCVRCQRLLDELTPAPAWSWLGELADADTAAPLPQVPGLELIEEVGRGGHGIVWRATELALRRTVAVKFLRFGRAASAAEQQRFRVEAEALARLRHPNIVPIFSTSEVDGLPYLVMEWQPGGSLASRSDRAPWSPTKAASLVEQLAGAVQAAHQAGVVHRDIKPANVLLDADGTPKLTDFGLAKLLDGPGGLTATEAVLGTPGFMAPEQAAGDCRSVGPVTDVYALGAILYELLTGRPPFQASTPFETLILVRDHDPVPPRRLVPAAPRDLETVCLKALHKEPSRRYGSAEALAADLRQYLAGRPVAARPVGWAERGWRWIRRHPTRATAAGLVVIGLVGAIAAGVWIRTRLRDDSAAARAEALVRSLPSAVPAAVPNLIDDLRPLGRWAEPHLRALLTDAPHGTRAVLYAQIALLDHDPDQAQRLIERIPRSEADELLLLCQALRGHERDVLTQVRSVLDGQTDADQRFRTAAVLAAFAPDDARWPALAPDAARQLAAENALAIGAWARAFEPVAGKLKPHLARLFRDTAIPEADRAIAAVLLAQFAADDVGLLADLISDGSVKQFGTLLAALARPSAPAAVRLGNICHERPPAGATEEQKDGFAARRAQAAVALARLGRPEEAWAILAEDGDDRRARAYLVHKLAPLGVNFVDIVERLFGVPDAPSRRALLVALGEYSPDRRDARATARLVDFALRAFRDDPDPGVHAAADWLLRQRLDRGADLDRIDRELAGQPPRGRRWFVNRLGDTFAIVPGPVEFWMGSQPDEPFREISDYSRHRHVIDKSFAIGLREVTLDRFRRFQQHHPEVNRGQTKIEQGHVLEPVRGISSYAAAKFCRWYSGEAGIPDAEMTYPSHEAIQPGFTLAPGYLRRTGYRLPTNAEWECACRAGTHTPRFYGFDTELLSKYAWHIGPARDRTWPVGSLKPNDLGLFDVLGNVWEFTQPAGVQELSTQDTSVPRLTTVDTEPLKYVNDPALFNIYTRGGSFLYHSSLTRSGMVYGAHADYSDITMGFRLARTLPADFR